MVLGFTHLLGLFGVLQAISAAPATSCQLQWGGVTIDGHLGDNNVCRYNIKYGSAERWGESQATASPADGSGLPPACPQGGFTYFTGNVPQSEDCLHMLAYVPQNADANTPIFTWLHGGSFRFGGASMSGIDGSALAAKGQVVFVPQYRLGMLGMMPPASSSTANDPNLALRDVVLALKSIKDNIGSKGNKNAVTLGGHSSGALMVRTLWSMPSAAGLFHRSMLQSDPSGQGLSTVSQYQAVRNKVYGYASLKDKSLAELKSANPSVFEEAINTLLSSLPYDAWLDSPNLSINPVYGTASLPSDPTAALVSNKGQLAVNPSNMPLFVSTTKDEAAYLVSGYWPNPIPQGYVMGAGNKGTIEYNSVMQGRCANGFDLRTQDTYWRDSAPDTVRRAVSLAVTDGGVRCSSRAVASGWAQKGGQAFVAEFTKGAPFLYSQSSGSSFCDDKVCHGNDVPLVFAHDNNNSAGFANEVADIWTKFIHGQSMGWNAYSANAKQQNTNIKAIGGGSVANCPKSGSNAFWGTKCTWNWQ